MDYAAVEAQALAIANQMMAERAKVDLYYLCSYILGGEGVLDPKVHGPLCRALRPLLFYKNPEAIEGIEFPSDWGRTDEEGMPNDEQKQEFLDWQNKFMPDADTGVVEDKFNIYLNKLLALMPRGTLKSTIITIGFTIQWHLNYPEDRVGIDSETWTKSKAFLAEIVGHYEKNKRLRIIYGTLYRNDDGSPMLPDQNSKHDTWNTEGINLSCRTRARKEPSIDTMGIEVTKNGMHYDLIVADDLHSEKNTKTVDQIEKAKEHFKLLYSLLDPGASMVVIGTRWDDDDLYQMIIDTKQATFNFITRAAEADDGDLFFPSRLTRTVLLEFRDALGGYLYSCQYLNNPVDQENATFVATQFKHVTIQQFNNIPHHLFGFVDPSYQGKHNTSDYAAFVLGAMGPRKEIYCRFAFKDKMKYSQIFDKMAELDDMFLPRLWWVEAIGTKSLEDDFDRMNDERVAQGKRRLNIRFNRSQPNSKTERIADLSPWYERGDAYHVQGGGMIDALESELKRFPKAKHDDLSDCWSGIIKKGFPPRHVESDEQVQKRKKYTKMLNKPRSPVTGY
jgi:predicted phage terminase large subunit-like protein